MNIVKERKKKKRKKKKLCMEMDHSVGRKKGLLGDQIPRVSLKSREEQLVWESLPGLKEEVVVRDMCFKTAWELQ